MRESDETAGAQDERTPDEGPKTDPTKTEGEKEAEDGPGDTTADIGSRLWALGWLTKAKKALGPTAWFQFLDWGRIEIGYEDQGARFAYTGSGADPGFLIDKLLLDRRARRGDPQVATCSSGCGTMFERRKGDPDVCDKCFATPGWWIRRDEDPLEAIPGAAILARAEAGFGTFVTIDPTEVQVTLGAVVDTENGPRQQVRFRPLLGARLLGLRKRGQ